MSQASERRARERIYDECIKHGHWMGDAPPSTPSWVTFGFVLRCNRGCETLRHLEIHPVTGTVTHSNYEWDPRYTEYRKGRKKQTERLDAVIARNRPRAKRAKPGKAKLTVVA